MGMRELKDLHDTNYNGFKSEKCIQEQITLWTRDNEEITATLVYMQDLISSESPFLIKYNLPEESLCEQLEMSIWDSCLLERGFVICYPQLRGGMHMGDIHFSKGSQIKKLTNFTDMVDLANFIQQKGLSNRILLYGENLGALTCLTAFLQNPYLFKGMVLHNGVYDLNDYLNTYREGQFENNKIEINVSNQIEINKINMFGDYNNDQDMHDFIFSYCPYQQLKYSYLQEQYNNILITTESNYPYSYHSRKLIARLRENDENQEVYFKEYLDVQNNVQEINLKSQQNAFIINSSFHRTASRNDNQTLQKIKYE